MKKSHQAPVRFTARVGPTGGEEPQAAAGMPRAGGVSRAEAAAAKAELQWLQPLAELCRAQSSSEGRKREMRTGINYRKTDRARTCHKWKKIEKQSQPSIVIKRKWFSLWLRADPAEAHKEKARAAWLHSLQENRCAVGKAHLQFAMKPFNLVIRNTCPLEK